jgi:3D (Asp-Asp-Asp) domain-containing protein
MKLIAAIVLMAFLFLSSGGKSTPYTATAYCLRGKTASGHRVAKGIVAADRRVLPLGTKIQLTSGEYSGTYVVRDTGGKIKGKKLDVLIPSCKSAVKFGKRKVLVTVIS